MRFFPRQIGSAGAGAARFLFRRRRGAEGAIEHDANAPLLLIRDPLDDAGDARALRLHVFERAVVGREDREHLRPPFVFEAAHDCFGRSFGLPFDTRDPAWLCRNEDRLTPAAITVTGKGDTIALDALTTLREAITSINNQADINNDVTLTRVGLYASQVGGTADVINFNIAGGGVQVIAVIGTPEPTLIMPLTINGYSQTSAVANTLNNVYVFGLPKDYPETFRAKVAALTPAQVRSGAETLLGSENSVIAIVGDWAKVKDQLSAFKNITFLDPDGKTIPAPQ